MKERSKVRGKRAKATDRKSAKLKRRAVQHAHPTFGPAERLSTVSFAVAEQPEVHQAKSYPLFLF
jgi:hypothetical protein